MKEVKEEERGKESERGGGMRDRKWKRERE